MTRKNVEIIKPDDWHVHLREDDILKYFLPYTYKNFKRALVMPNLKIPITSLSGAESYYKEISARIPKDIEFNPLMTLYLSEAININLIRSLSRHKTIKAIKMYPKGATTNSEFGVSNFKSYLFTIIICIFRQSICKNTSS